MQLPCEIRNTRHAFMQFKCLSSFQRVYSGAKVENRILELKLETKYLEGKVEFNDSTDLVS